MLRPYGRDPGAVRAFSCLVALLPGMGVHMNPLIEATTFGGRNQFFMKLPNLSARKLGVFGRGSRGRRFCKNASPG